MSLGIPRRGFLQGSAAAVGLGALGISEPAWSAPAGTPRIRGHGTLGKTGLRISDISFGSARSKDPALARHAFERGINYFDTAVRVR